MRLGRGLAFVADQLELPIVGRQIDRHEALDLTFALQSMLDEFGDRDNLEIMLLAEGEQFRDTGHGPVLVHDLTDHGRRFQARQTGQIDRSFGLPGADQNAAVSGA